VSQPLIQLKGVDFLHSPDRQVLRGVDLELCPGQRLGLVGPNGSGKTTLLHLIVGLIKPTAGRIIAFGRERRVEADFREVRRRAGLLFQDPEDQLFSPTVMEDVVFGPLNLGLDRHSAHHRALEALDRLGLASYADRITYRLSGGEKRLVSLATVLAMEPEVLLLDEPSSGLDEDSASRLRRILADLDQAMIVVSHQKDLLQAVAGRVAHLNGGRLNWPGQ